MRPARVVAILLLAFLFGGSSAEVAVQTKRAIERARTAEEGSAGELVAFEIHRDGELLARPRVISPPGRATQLVLRDPQDPGLVRLALRLETTREPTGDILVDYEITVPSDEVVAVGRVSATHGVEHSLDLGERITAKLLTLPVPSTAFDAYIQGERAARRGNRPT
jgi:hypothetical protein